MMAEPRLSVDQVLAAFLQPRFWCAVCGDGYATEIARDACQELHAVPPPTREPSP